MKAFRRFTLDRFVTLLIIPFLALGNSFAHTHGDGQVDAEHGIRPHIHLGHLSRDHHEHDHAHERQDSEHFTFEIPADHDSDAVYLGNGQLFLPHVEHQNLSDTECFDGLSPRQAFVFVESRSAPVVHYLCLHQGPPLFLLHAALRL